MGKCADVQIPDSNSIIILVSFKKHKEPDNKFAYLHIVSLAH